MSDIEQYGTAIVSIGENCCPAELIQSAGLRTESMIFDRARSNLLAIADVVKNGYEWHIEQNVREVPLPEYRGVHYKRLNWPHHPWPDRHDYMVRCAIRFFNALKLSRELHLLHCTPNPINIDHVISLEKAVALQRKDFRIVAMQGLAGDKSDIIEDVELSNNVRLLKVSAEKEFHNNRMRGPFYIELFKYAFPNVSELGQYGLEGAIV